MSLYYVNAPVVEHPSVGRARLRRRLVAAIDRLIMALDHLDGDADLEPDGSDEPSLSFRLAMDQDNAIRTEPLGLDWIDAEDACEDEGAITGDDEPRGRLVTANRPRCPERVACNAP